jgi:nitrite reductase/ring-hydroxylating ferredoxin subunit
MNKYIKFKKALILTSILIISFYINSCDKHQSPIPNVHVDFYIDLNDPLYNNLAFIPGSYEYVTGGVNGILVYHTLDNTFTAYERTCPHDPECGKVYVDKTGFYAVDSACCKSEFSLLSNGIPVNDSPSQFPLKMYNCQHDIGNNILHITN